MAKREFVCLEVYIKADDHTWLAISSSVDSGHVPLNPAIVRGNLLVSGYLIREYVQCLLGYPPLNSPLLSLSLSHILRMPHSASACSVTTLTQV